MCKLPKVVIVAPEDAQLDLRKKLSSLEYDIAATVASVGDAADITADVVILTNADADAVTAVQAKGAKAVVIGPDAHGAELAIAEPAEFKSRWWELFRPT